MTAGSVIVLAFWVIFTVRKHFTPKLAAAEKANTYDLNRDNPGSEAGRTAPPWSAGGGKMGLACGRMGRKPSLRCFWSRGWGSCWARY